ncbi:MAG: hypothetical protein QXY39_01730 [Thermofilaceae archaeon]
MKVRKTLMLSADVARALEELSDEYGIPIGELVELMYRKIGGRKGLESILNSGGFSVTAESGMSDKRENGGYDVSRIIWMLMDMQPLPQEEQF